jgi:hypothetical protein
MNSRISPSISPTFLLKTQPPQTITQAHSLIAEKKTLGELIPEPLKVNDVAKVSIYQASTDERELHYGTLKLSK